MRIFIETTIPSYLASRPARDIVQAARQQITRDWWNRHRHGHELFTSQAVLNEIARGDTTQAEDRMAVLRQIPLLGAVAAAEAFTRRILAARILPARASTDAAHIAVATVHGMDILLSWNCRHLANAAIHAPLRRLAAIDGYDLPEICTPEELLEETT